MIRSNEIEVVIPSDIKIVLNTQGISNINQVCLYFEFTDRQGNAYNCAWNGFDTTKNINCKLNQTDGKIHLIIERYNLCEGYLSCKCGIATADVEFYDNLWQWYESPQNTLIKLVRGNCSNVATVIQADFTISNAQAITAQSTPPFDKNVINSISVNGVDVSPDSSKNVNISIPTTTSDLANDAGFITMIVNNLTFYYTKDEVDSKLNSKQNVIDSAHKLSVSNIEGLAQVATSGSYTDLSNKPTIPTKTSEITNDSNYITNSVDNLTNYTKTSELSSVATSGNYNDLSNKPNVASNLLNGSASGSLRGINTKAEDGTYTMGVNSFACGNSTKSSGDCSHSEGGGTIASGDCSHSEGAGTIASGDCSHAEGGGTRASGLDSHSEGISTNASGEYSHAEGRGTTASGNSAHAEGAGTIASGIYSHTEGSGTIASGIYSHAEGEVTIASGSCQHVSGKYNIEDSNSIYSEIIGGGTSQSNKANIRTLDWNGNEVLSGGLTASYVVSIGVNTNSLLVAGMRNHPTNENFTLPSEQGTAEYNGRFTAENAGEISTTGVIWKGDTTLKSGYTYEFSICEGIGFISEIYGPATTSEEEA